MTFKQSVAKAKLLHQSQAEIEAWGSRTVNVVTQRNEGQRYTYNSRNPSSNKFVNKYQNNRNKCFRCNRSNHSPNVSNFKNKTCYNCNKVGHIASASKSRSYRHKNNNTYNRPRPIINVNSYNTLDSFEEHPEEFEVIHNINGKSTLDNWRKVKNRRDSRREKTMYFYECRFNKEQVQQPTRQWNWPGK
jgi:hypothetical protein